MEIAIGKTYEYKGSKYIVRGFATNKTYTQDKQEMIIYSVQHFSKMYVREISEFKSKFN